MSGTVVKLINGMQFIGRGRSGHALLMDASPKGGGSDSAATPLEALLCSIGGCTGMDVVSILRKMRTPVEGLVVEIDEQRKETRPTALTKVHLTYRVTGDVPEKNAKKAISMSLEKYCPITNSLSAEITTEVVVGDK